MWFCEGFKFSCKPTLPVQSSNSLVLSLTLHNFEKMHIIEFTERTKFYVHYICTHIQGFHIKKNNRKNQITTQHDEVKNKTVHSILVLYCCPSNLVSLILNSFWLFGQWLPYNFIIWLKNVAAPLLYVLSPPPNYRLFHLCLSLCICLCYMVG